MNGERAGESILEAVLDDADGHAVEAFSLLSDETRLSILIALWEASSPDEAVAFSDLRERVGIRDSGKFNYHLDQLTGQYVHRTDAGYRLTNAGGRIVRTVLAWSQQEDVTFEPVEIDAHCPFCGAPVTVSYRNERVFIGCTDCRGGGPRLDDNIVVGAFPPAGVRDREPAAVFENAVAYIVVYITRAMLSGVCLVCGGPVSAWLNVCEAHTDEGICETCETPFLSTVECRCETCKVPNVAPGAATVISHPAVITHLNNQGIEHDPTTWDGFMGRVTACDETLISTDPPQVRIDVPAQETAISVTVDEAGQVVDTTSSDH